MADPQSTSQSSADEALARLEQLTRLETQLRDQIEHERKERPPTSEELQAAIEKAQDEIDVIQAKIHAAKSEAKQLKAEIEEMEKSYQRLPETNRLAEWPMLVGEKMQRLAEVRIREIEIGRLELEKLAATGRLEAANHRQAAIEAGVYALPFEEDPRLLSLQAEKAEAEAALKGAQPGAKGE